MATEQLWSSLDIYPAWRTLRENLHELAFLLGRAGKGEDSPAGELARQIELILADPQTAADLLPADYRVRLPLGKASPDADEDELAAWMVDLARHIADVPVLLEAPDPARDLGQILTSELPRAWAARLSGPLFRLRQLVRGGGRPRASALPSAAALPATSLRFVVLRGGVWNVVLSAGADQELCARYELTYLVLRHLGPDAARLHLALLASPDEASFADVLSALGLSAAPSARRAGTELAYAALARLRQVRLSLVTWNAHGWERRSVPLWEVAVREYGQACLDERSGALAAHGAQWAFIPAPESWAPAPGGALAAGARELLYDRRGRSNGLSLATAVLLGLADSPEAVLPSGAVLALARVAPGPGLRNRLRTAARLQRPGGWEPDFSLWPEADDELASAPTVYRTSGVHQP